MRLALRPYARGGRYEDDDDDEEEEDEDGALLYDDEGGLATMVSKLAGVDGQPTMHRVKLAWKQRAVVPLLVVSNDSQGGSTDEQPSSTRTTALRSFFTSHETAELRGCGEAGKDGTAVVHRFRLADSALSRTLALEAIRAAASTPGETVSNRNGSWHSAANVLQRQEVDHDDHDEGEWSRDTVDALSATLRDAIRLAWGAAADSDSDDSDDSDGDGDGDGGGEQTQCQTHHTTHTPTMSAGLRAAAEKFASSATVHAWLNVSPPGGYHSRHEHGGAMFSGALYCAVPEAEMRGEGEDPTMESVHSAALVFCPENGTGSFAAMSPEVNSLVLFPGWLVHCVLPMRRRRVTNNCRTTAGANVGAAGGVASGSGSGSGSGGEGGEDEGNDSSAEEKRISASFNAYRKGDALRALLAQKLRQRDAVRSAAAAAASAAANGM